MTLRRTFPLAGALLVSSVSAFALVGASAPAGGPVAPLGDVLPAPRQVRPAKGQLRLTRMPAMAMLGTGAAGVGRQLSTELAARWGWKASTKPGAVPLTLALVAKDAPGTTGLGREGYRLTIAPKSIRIEAPRAAGLFYGVQTLLQLLPAKGPLGTDGAALPCGTLQDGPRFAWRGMHLDVSRHFFDKDFIKRYLDLLARHKLNVFHWHLTDDAGWRLEIKKRPRLTEIGAWRDDRRAEPWDYEQRLPVPERPAYGGFYTQDDVREVVAYAAERFITVVPEIEMPGHSWAALAAFPELSCRGVLFKKPAGVPFEFSDPFCAGNDATFALLDDVLTEVAALFPSPWIHAGGDECKKAPWLACPNCLARMEQLGLKTGEELQSYFMKRVERLIKSKRRRLIGWDEILEGGLPPDAGVMSWRGDRHGLEAARQGHDVVFAPGDVVYLDARQERAVNPLGLETVFRYDPLPAGTAPAIARHVLGVEGCLWTEEVQTPEAVEATLLPRLAALAEVGWGPPASERDFESFTARMGRHFARLDALGVRYYVAPPQGLDDGVFLGETAEVTPRSALPAASVHYTLDGSEPTPTSPVVTGPLSVRHGLELRVRTALPGGALSQTVGVRFRREPLRPALSGKAAAAGTRPGLRLRRWAGTIATLNDFGRLKRVGESVAEGVALPADLQGSDRFGLEFAGRIRIPSDGLYRFAVASDDGSRLYVDGQRVVDNDGVHGEQWRAGRIGLAAGLHELRLEYFEAAFGETLQAEWEGPGVPRQPLAGEALAHVE